MITTIGRKRQKMTPIVKKLEKIFEISNAVHEIRDRMKNNDEYEQTSKLQNSVKEKLNAFYKEHNNYPADDKDIKRFLRAHTASKGIYEALIVEIPRYSIQKHI